MMDVSGSMGPEQKEIVRLESFWIDTWLRSQYNRIELRYIVHDAAAKEVDHETFFTFAKAAAQKFRPPISSVTRSSTNNFIPHDWNIYLFHFSDGDNWDGGDTAECISLLENESAAKSQSFLLRPGEKRLWQRRLSYGFEEHFPEEPRFVLPRSTAKTRFTIRSNIFGERTMNLSPELEKLRDEIKEYALEYGLDPFETIFEILDFDQINEVASYGGFPTRYPHWSLRNGI